LRALMIVNPAAGKRTAAPEDLEKSVAIIRRAGFELQIVNTDPSHPTAVELARRAVHEGYEACIVAGGDGTVAAAAAALLGSPVVLGILPFGSFMNITRGIGIPLEPRAAANIIARRRTRSVDVGEVNGKVFFETAGVGLDAELFGAARHVERGSWRRALRRVARWATRDTHRVTVSIDGETHSHRVMQVLVLNSPYYAWAIRLLPEASMEDGLLDVAVFPRMGRRRLIGTLFTLWRGAALPDRPVLYRSADIKIESDEQVAVHADGAFAGGLPARFVCRRGALTVFG
jgi:YegS/Rv2252/BmrU family lipid kinase